MLLRLWQAERPRAVVVGWDTVALRYRTDMLPGYQAGREFDPELLEQLDLLPELIASTGIVCGKAAGYEADDFLAAAVAQEESRGGQTLVATSDRDAFQLASDATTILQPTRGVSEMVRVGPAQVRERYGVEPEQVVDFIALRGDPSDRIPGARGVGPKTAASLLTAHGTLDALLGAGRFAAEAAALADYRRIATLDPSAPLPEITIGSRTGPRAPPLRVSSASNASPAGSRKPRRPSADGARQRCRVRAASSDVASRARGMRAASRSDPGRARACDGRPSGNEGGAGARP